MINDFLERVRGMLCGGEIGRLIEGFIRGVAIGTSFLSRVKTIDKPLRQVLKLSGHYPKPTKGYRVYIVSWLFANGNRDFSDGKT